MPFYKWIIQTPDTPKIRQENNYDDPKNKTCDVNLTANKRMVNVIRHISQLARVADDVFGAIDIECRGLIQRTRDLTTRIQSCQAVVDKLNAKTVKVPVSTLTENQVPRIPFINCDVKDLGHPPIFCTIPRPPEVDRLRCLANGPSPPALIPCAEDIVPETDGDPGTSSGASKTHIYCQPLKIQEPRKCKNTNAENSDKIDKAMTSAAKVPSSVVPIDVSGQPFSRMSSFRRSLIHVDFFIRRKKKDKRRNTVTEGETKELKEALQNIINGERQHTVVPNGTSQKNTISNGMHKPQLEDSILPKSFGEETNNNNSTKEVTSVEREFSNSAKRNNNYLEQTKAHISPNSNLKLNGNCSESGKITIYKRKPKSHLPISTISAAMNVAVEMRQLNGTEEQSSSGNWSGGSDHNSSDSDNKKNGDYDKDLDQCTVNGEDSGFSDSYKAYKNRQKDTRKISSSKEHPGNEEVEAFSSASSENNTIQDDASSNATSVESDAFFISSDESDEGSSDIFEQKYGSSTSLSTISDGSLNSLLSQTGTEMASSTGTLTSIGFERFPTPPPPPPPFVIVAPKNELLADTPPHLTKVDKNCSKYPSSKTTPKRDTASKSNRKNSSPQKLIKPTSTEKHEWKKNSADNSRGIFTSLVSKKSRTKDQTKSKDVGIKIPASQTKPFFDMYGNNSPQKVSRLPIFIKENIQPLSENEPKAHLQSFLPNDSKNECRIKQENKNSLTPNQLSSIIDEVDVPPGANVFTEDTTPINNAEIPLKYVQKVVVTPISRQTTDENSVKYLCRKSLFKDIDGPNHRADSDATLKSQDFYQEQNKSNTRSFSGSNPGKPQRPNTLQAATKPAARVMLDPEGRVIYSTNSLDRRLPYAYPSPCPVTISNFNDQSRYNTVQNTQCNLHYSQNSGFQNTPNRAYTTNEIVYFDKHLMNKGCSTYNDPLNRNSEPKISEFHPNPNLSNWQNFRLKDELEAKNNVHRPELRESYFSHPTEKFANRKVPPPYEEALGRRYSQILAVSPPDPNISGLPTKDTMLTQQNVCLHSQNMERLSRLELQNISNSHTSMSPSQVSIKSPLNSNLCTSQGSTMSTEDLFAVIHDCKKRMNIKTDSDISLASSSRSSSPSYLRPPQSRGSFVETGFLSPRSSNLDQSGDRRSWADFRPSSSMPNERKGLASDRLGRSKPTSMHDFKMLLLQARSSTQLSGPRKSAVEMLKVPSSPSGTPVSPPGISPNSTTSFSVQNSPTSPLFIHSGHSTVPFKRHNNRMRNSMQSRYTIYPPIFEDCSEEAENCRDIIATPND